MHLVYDICRDQLATPLTQPAAIYLNSHVSLPFRYKDRFIADRATSFKLRGHHQSAFRERSTARLKIQTACDIIIGRATIALLEATFRKLPASYCFSWTVQVPSLSQACLQARRKRSSDTTQYIHTFACVECAWLYNHTVSILHPPYTTWTPSLDQSWKSMVSGARRLPRWWAPLHRESTQLTHRISVFHNLVRRGFLGAPQHIFIPEPLTYTNFPRVSN